VITLKRKVLKIITNYLDLWCVYYNLNTEISQAAQIDWTQLSLLCNNRKKIRTKIDNCLNIIGNTLIKDTNKSSISSKNMSKPLLFKNLQIINDYLFINLPTGSIGIGLNNTGNKNLIKSRRKGDYIIHIHGTTGPILSVRQQNLLPLACNMAFWSSNNSKFLSGAVSVALKEKTIIRTHKKRFIFVFKESIINLANNRLFIKIDNNVLAFSLQGPGIDCYKYVGYSWRTLFSLLRPNISIN